MHAYRTHTCGALRRPRSAARRACRAGCIASATTASCCSSTCATITASPSACSTPRARSSRRPRRCGSRAWSPSPARWSRAAAETVNPSCRPARSSCAIERLRRAVGGRGAAAAGRTATSDYRRGDPAALPLPRPAPREDAAQHRAALRRSSPRIRRRMIEQGFTEFQTPILTASLARGRARLPGAVAAASRQVLRAAAGAAAVQAAADGRGLRPLLPDRALLPRRGRAAPTARPGEFYQLDFEMSFVDAGGRVRGDRAGDRTACSRSSPTAAR